MQNVLITAMLVTVSAGKDNALHLYELEPDSEKLVQHASATSLARLENARCWRVLLRLGHRLLSFLDA